VRRTQALIAVGVAVAVAAAVVVVGMNSGGGEPADAAGGASSTAAGTLPSGHPSVAVDQEAPTAGADADRDADSSDPIAQLEKRRAKDPTDVAVLLDLGKAYFMSQRLQQSEESYSAALAQEPGNAMAQVGLAMVWHAQGDSKRAETALHLVLDAHPDDQEAHYSLAIVYFSTGRVGDAKAQWETAARIDPTSTAGRRSQSFVDLLEDQKSSAPQPN
jgi:cytochrome c-type biogenesis protein CcmH/NrfG